MAWLCAYFEYQATPNRGFNSHILVFTLVDFVDKMIQTGINCDGSSESEQGSGCVYYTYEVTGLFYPNAKRWCQQFVMNDEEHIKHRVRAAPPWRPCVLREAFRRHSKIKQNITHCRVIQFRTPCRYVSNLEHL